MADEGKKNPEEEGEKSEGKIKKKSSLPLLIGLIAGQLIFVTVIAFVMIRFFQAPQDREERPDKTEQRSSDSEDARTSDDEYIEEEVILTEASFETVVNIAGTEGTRFLKVNLELAYDAGKKKNKKLLETAATMSSNFKSIAIDHLSSLTLKEVLDPNAQKNISSDLLIKFNNALPLQAGEFSNVYITEFIVQ
ncbi:MAG: flagellar basal body-associated FliL family protein [Fibrobacterota bacterium]